MTRWRNILILTLKKEWMLLIALKKTCFKLMINAVSGKTMENLRKRINVRLGNNEKDFLKWEGFKKVLIKTRHSHRWSQIKISAWKQILDKWIDRGTRQ